MLHDAYFSLTLPAPFAPDIDNSHSPSYAFPSLSLKDSQGAHPHCLAAMSLVMHSKWCRPRRRIRAFCSGSTFKDLICH
jgi:hypothetical protein